MCAQEGLQGPGKCQNGCTSIPPLPRERGGYTKRGTIGRLPLELPLQRGRPLLLGKQPVWAAGDIPHLMPVEHGLPSHSVVTGVAGQAIPLIVAASHAYALQSPPFLFPVPAVLVASPALLRPSSLFVVLALVPPRVAPAFCVSVLLLPPSLGAAPVAHPLLSYPPFPPYEGFTSPYDAECPVRGWLVTALLPPLWRAPPGARGVGGGQWGSVSAPGIFFDPCPTGDLLEGALSGLT